MRDGYVFDVEPACRESKCMLGSAAAVLRQAEEIVKRNGRDGMSAALWCDQGAHAFSERDPGRQRIQVNMLDDNETETEITKDFCGDCAAKAGLTQPRRTRPTLPAAVDG